MNRLLFTKKDITEDLVTRPLLTKQNIKKNFYNQDYAQEGRQEKEHQPTIQQRTISRTQQEEYVRLHYDDCEEDINAIATNNNNLSLSTFTTFHMKPGKHLYNTQMSTNTMCTLYIC